MHEFFKLIKNIIKYPQGSFFYLLVIICINLSITLPIDCLHDIASKIQYMLFVVAATLFLCAEHSGGVTGRAVLCRQGASQPGGNPAGSLESV